MVLPIFGQKISVDIGDEINEDKYRFAGHLHSDEDHYVYFTTPPKLFDDQRRIYLKKYNKNFKEVYSKELKPKKKNIYTHGLEYFGNQFVMLQYENDRKGKKHKYLITPYDKDGKVKKAIPVASINKRKGIFKNAGHDSRWKISNDNTRLLFYAEQVGLKKESKYQVFVSLMNEKLEKVWGEKIVLPYVQDRIYINDIEFGSDNSLYIIAQVYEKKSGKKKIFKSNKKVDYRMTIFKIQDGKDVVEYKFDMKGKFIKNIALAENKDQLIAVGLIGEKRMGPITGVTNMRLNKETGEVLLAKSRSFTKREMDSFGRKSTDYAGKKGKRGLEDTFQMRNLILKKDGGITLAAEQYYTKIEYNDNNTTVARTRFFNNHIVVVDIDPEGEINYVKMIPRRIKRRVKRAPIAVNLQKATHIMFFEPLVYNDNIYYLYNDDRKNFEKKISDPDKYKRLTSSRESITVLSHFDEKNRLVKKKIFDTDEINSLVAPKFCKQISPNEMFFFSYKINLLKANKIRLGILKIEE